MTIEEFDKAFGPVIRSLFNRKRALKEQWPVEMKIIKDRDTLRNIQVTWYRGGGLLDEESRRLTLPEASLGRGDVLEIASSLANYGNHCVLTLPCYKLGKALILLDGCHRASALWLADVPFTLILFIVKGPKDERGLWDLAHES